MEIKKRKLLLAIVVSYIIFTLGWFVRETYIDFSHMNPYLEAGINFVIYGIWWSGLAFCLIHFYKNELCWDLKEILMKKPHMRVLLISLIVIVVYYLICWVVGGYHINMEMNRLDYFLTVIGVGIFEESVFRGWFYNAWSAIVRERYANIISAAMFVFIHYPRWFQLGRSWGDIVYGSVYVFILGVLFGIIFRKNHSIWTPAILHSVWDALGFLI